MPTRTVRRLPAAAFAALLAIPAFIAPTPIVAAGGAWIDNGATACEKYLTPDVVASILRSPAGKPRRLDAHSCNVGPIYISLIVADIDVFRMEVPNIFGAHPIAGIGDGAFWNGAGALSSVKGHSRGCEISVIDPEQRRSTTQSLDRSSVRFVTNYSPYRDLPVRTELERSPNPCCRQIRPNRNRE